MSKTDRSGAREYRMGAAGFLALTLATLTLVTPATEARAEDEPQADAAALSTSTSGDCSFGVATVRGARRLNIQRAPDEFLREGRMAFGSSGSSLARSHSPAGFPSSYTPARTHRGTIDIEIFGKMAADGIAPADRSTDAEFLRRVMLDLTGQIPSTAGLTAFLADQRPEKRALAVEDLLRSDAFNDRWAMWLGDLLENVKTTAANGVEQPLGRDAFSSYLRTSLAQAKPYDQLVREILAGNGDSFTSGPPNFWVRNLATMGVAQDTWDNQGAAAGEKFLGMQENCTGCHNGAGHTDSVNVYLSTKTRMDFWKNAAFFAQTTVTTAMDPASAQRKYLLSDNTTGSYLLNTTSGNRPARAPVTGQPNKVDPAFYLTGEKPQPGKPLRAEFARMLTAHPQFARAAVNYLWKEMFGVGIVEPADGFDLYRLDPAALPPGQTLQASHPALLAQLATQFASGGYDLRALLRTMANSEAYQLSARYTPGTWNETYTRYFARRITRRMTSEQILDAVFSASGVWPSGTSPDALTVRGWTTPPARAMQLPDPLEAAAGTRYNAFLNTFLRGNRDTNPRSSDTSALQALALMNDANTILPRILQSNASSLVARTLKATTKPEDVVDALWLGTLSRPPSTAEKVSAVTYLKSGTLGPKTENLQWALFNKLEFAFY